MIPTSTIRRIPRWSRSPGCARTSSPSYRTTSCEKLMERCRKIELDKQAQMKADNRRFIGRKKLSKSKWWTKASSWEDRYELEPQGRLVRQVAAYRRDPARPALGARVRQVSRGAPRRGGPRVPLRHVRVARATTCAWLRSLRSQVKYRRDGVASAAPPSCIGSSSTADPLLARKASPRPHFGPCRAPIARTSATRGPARPPPAHSSYRDGVHMANWIARRYGIKNPALPEHWR